MGNICERGGRNNNLEGEKVHRHKPDNNVHPYTQRYSNFEPTKSGNIQSSYPTPVQPPPRITRSQVRTAIEKLSPKKAPGPDEIPNLILQKCYDELEDHLLWLAQEVLRLFTSQPPSKNR